MNVAQTILTQLGGNRFAAMTGAKDFVADGETLQFKLPANFAARKINFVQITLTPADVYTVKFYQWKARQMVLEMVEQVEEVYATELREVFKNITGLDVHL